MHELYELKEKLMNELKDYGSKEMSAGSLEVVDKLTHTIKNLCKIIEEMEESGYAEMYDGGGFYKGGNSYRRGGSSYARGRGSNARRDSMGRYASEGGYYRADENFRSKLYSLMEDAPDEKTRSEIERIMSKM